MKTPFNLRLILLVALALTTTQAVGTNSQTSTPQLPGDKPLLRCQFSEPGHILVIQVVGDLVLIARDREIDALSIEDCSVRWRWHGNYLFGEIPVFFEDTLYVTDQEQPHEVPSDLVALDAVTGIEKWRIKIDWRIGINLHAGVLLIQGLSEIVGLDPESGTILWRTPTAKHDEFSPVPIQGGYVLMTEEETSPSGFANTKILARAVRTGEVTWSLNFDDGVVESIATGPESIAIIHVLFARGTQISHSQFGVDVSSGEQLWEQKYKLYGPIHIVGQWAYGTQSTADDFFSLITSDDPLSLIAFDVRTGNLAWIADIPGAIELLSHTRDTVLFGVLDPTLKSNPGRMIAFESDTGSLQWARLNNLYGYIDWQLQNSSVVYADGAALRAIDIDTGKQLWSYAADWMNPFPTFAVGADVVVVSDFIDAPALFILEPPSPSRSHP